MMAGPSLYLSHFTIDVFKVQTADKDEFEEDTQSCSAIIIPPTGVSVFDFQTKS